MKVSECWQIASRATFGEIESLVGIETNAILLFRTTYKFPHYYDLIARYAIGVHAPFR